MMKLTNFFIIVLIPFISTLQSCKKSSKTTAATTTTTSTYECKSSAVAKGSRQFGMDILDEPSSGGSYATSFQYLRNMGGTFQTYHVNWSQIEGAGSGTTSGTFTDPSGALAALESEANSTGTSITLRIHPVDVPGKYVPSDLTNERFNTTTMSTRFQNMLSFVFTKLSASHVSHIVIGNEVDGYNPSTDSNFWYDYPVFLYNMKVWLTNNYPTLKLGFVVTMGGITSNAILPNSGNQRAQTIFTSWLNSVDLLGVTYYPISSQYSVKANSLIASEFQTLTSFTSMPIHIEEVGYPTSSQNGGSENLQKEFFCEVFKAWDRYPTQIKTVAILRMVDKTRAAAVQTAADYGLSGNENFIEYIRSLGVRTNVNQSKTAFDMVKDELSKRGF